MAVNDVSAFNAQLWSQILIPNLDQVNVMLPMTNRAWDGQLNNVGDTVQVRTLGNVLTKQYVKGVTKIDYQALTPVLEPLTVNDSFYFAFNVDDVEKIQNDMSLLMLYGKRAAVASSNSIEAKIMAAIPTGALAANAVTGASSAAITLDSGTSATGIYTNIVTAGARLTTQNVPLNDRWMVMGPDDLALIQQDTAHFIRATELGDAIVTRGTADGQTYAVPGLVGECCGFKLYVANTYPVVGGSRYLPYGQGAPIAYVSQLNDMETIRLQDSFGTAMRGLVLHDTKVFGESSKQLGYIKAA